MTKELTGVEKFEVGDIVFVKNGFGSNFWWIGMIFDVDKPSYMFEEIILYHAHKPTLNMTRKPAWYRFSRYVRRECTKIN